MPNFPTVNAMAPKAPSGAAHIMMPTMTKTILAAIVDDIDEGLRLVADPHQREAGQDGDEQHLQDVAVGKGADEGVAE